MSAVKMITKFEGARWGFSTRLNQAAKKRRKPQHKKLHTQ
jgi:hypothetical protein